MRPQLVVIDTHRGMHVTILESNYRQELKGRKEKKLKSSDVLQRKIYLPLEMGDCITASPFEFSSYATSHSHCITEAKLQITCHKTSLFLVIDLLIIRFGPTI